MLAFAAGTRCVNASATSATSGRNRLAIDYGPALFMRTPSSATTGEKFTCLDIRTARKDATRHTPGRNRILSVNRSYLAPARTHHVAQLLDKKLPWALYAPGIYRRVFVCQTCRPPPELVARPAAVSGCFADLLFFWSHSSCRRADRRASLRRGTLGRSHHFNFRGATPDAESSRMALSRFANRVDDFCRSNWLGFGAAAGFAQQGSSP